MAFCAKCGTQIGEGVNFCPGCGAPVEAQGQANQNSQANSNGGNTAENIGKKIADLNNTADYSANFDNQDIESNKAMAILAYFGPLVLIPIFAAPNSKYARYHANQGILLLILEVAYSIVQAILQAILKAIFPWNWSIGYFGGRGAIYNILNGVIGLVWIVVPVLIVIGIINAVQGRAKELPVIGKFKILK